MRALQCFLTIYGKKYLKTTEPCAPSNTYLLTYVAGMELTMKSCGIPQSSYQGPTFVSIDSVASQPHQYKIPQNTFMTSCA